MPNATHCTVNTCLVNVLDVIFTAQDQTPISGCPWQVSKTQRNLHILKINHFDSNFTLELFVPAA